MKLIRITNIEGIIELDSGLHIGAGSDEMHIGGTDNPIIKHPNTGEPYIPGSSIKGKVRSLLELESGLMVHTNGEPVSATIFSNIKTPDEKQKCDKILKLFGTGASNINETNFGVTRVSFADCNIDSNWLSEARKKNYVFTDVKSENTINRISGTASNPRQTERAPEGVKFNFKVSIKNFEEDNGDDLINYLLYGLKLLQLDAIGGNSSRGYGRFHFENLKEDGEDISTKFKNLEPFSKKG